MVEKKKSSPAKTPTTTNRFPSLTYFTFFISSVAQSTCNFYVSFSGNRYWRGDPQLPPRKGHITWVIRQLTGDKPLLAFPLEECVDLNFSLIRGWFMEKLLVIIFCTFHVQHYHYHHHHTRTCNHILLSFPRIKELTNPSFISSRRSAVVETDCPSSI